MNFAQESGMFDIKTEAASPAASKEEEDEEEEVTFQLESEQKSRFPNWPDKVPAVKVGKSDYPWIWMWTTETQVSQPTW